MNSVISRIRRTTEQTEAEGLIGDRPSHTAPPSRPRLSLPAAITGTVLAVAVGFVLLQLQPSLLVRETTPAGGDMGAHVWTPHYLRHHLLPDGRITGWAPDWYAGFPVLHFYFPLPSLLIVALSFVLPYTIAFKFVSVAGVLSLPLAAYAFGRLSGLRFPTPALLGVVTIPFLFDQFHTIYGGNIPATLAGEFSFSLSLSVGLVFLGVFARGLETGRHRALAAVLLAATALCHLLPTFFVLAGAGVLLALRADRHRLRYTLTSLPVAGLLGAFWALPFVWKLPYTTDMGWEKKTAYLKNLFPFISPCQADGTCGADQFPLAYTRHLSIVVLLAVVGAISSIVQARRHHQRTGLFLTIMTLASAAVFVLAPQARLWNARALPFWFLCLYLLAALGVAVLVHMVSTSFAHRPRHVQVDTESQLTTAAWPALVAPVLLLGVVLVLVGHPLGALPRWVPRFGGHNEASFIDDWARWNYSGYEAKPAYPEYRAIVGTMARVGRERGCGRAHWEYEASLDRYGTPMALMLLPYWTDGCIDSMEGLYFESSATTPFHFLHAAELSKAPSNPQRGLPYPTLDLNLGVAHLQMMGVRYYLAFSPEALAAASVHPGLTQVAASGPWQVFEVLHSPLVEALEHEPAVLDGLGNHKRAWLDVAVPWHQDPTRWGVALAESGPPDWQRVAVRQSSTPTPTESSATPPPVGTGMTVETPERRALPPVSISALDVGNDRIAFDVDRTGVPVVIKASYFPNWRASGALGPYRLTPNLMVVVPTATHVELHYGWTPTDLVAIVASLLGLVAVAVLARRPPLVYPVPPKSPPNRRLQPFSPQGEAEAGQVLDGAKNSTSDRSP
jgi:hypothetical protein